VECEETALPPGAFAEVCLKACDWFNRHRAKRLGPMLVKYKPGDPPRLLPRIY
jgi:hypothetical protein